MQIQLEIKGLDKMLSRFRSAPAQLKIIKTEMLSTLGLFAEREAKKNLKDNGSIHTGKLRNSITHRVSISGDEARVGTNLIYGIVIEKGRKSKRMPPFGPGSELREWARKKLGNENLAFVVARSIAQKGTKPKPYMEPAFNMTQKKAGPTIQAAGIKIISALKF